EPSVGGSQELMIRIGTLRDERGPARNEDVTVYQVIGRIADEGVAAVWLGEQIGGIDDWTTCRGDVAPRHQFRGWEAPGICSSGAAGGPLHAPRLERTDAIHLAGRVVVGDVERNRADRQRGVAPQVMI